MNYFYYNYFMNRLNVTQDLYNLLMSKFNSKSLNVNDTRNLAWCYRLRLVSELTASKKIKWRFIWHICDYTVYLLFCVGLVSECFSWSDIKRDALTWGDQRNADKINIIIISGFGMKI